jgi:hypothetical protein
MKIERIPSDAVRYSTLGAFACVPLCPPTVFMLMYFHASIHERHL